MRYKPKKMIKIKGTRETAQGTIKAWMTLKNYIHRVMKGYTKEVIIFERKSQVPKWDQHYDISSLYDKQKMPFNFWLYYWFFVSFAGFYTLATLWYDTDVQYYGYVTFPRQMKYFDMGKDFICFKWRAFLATLPFGGQMPDITRPENYNKFKRELKNHLFNTEEKALKKQRALEELQKESEAYDQTLNDVSKFIETQSLKISKMKVEENS